MAMQLTETQAKVLAATRLDANAPIPDTAKTLGLKENSVRSALQRLTQQRVIMRVPMINISKLGYTEYDVTCALALNGDLKRESFINYLRKSPLVSQILETGGIYHCAFTVCARTPSEVDRFLQQICTRFGSVFVSKTIGVCLSYTIFPPKFLSKKGSAKKFISVPTCALEPELKKKDRDILRTISFNPEYSMRDVARELGVPISTLSYRFRVLTETETLLGYIYLIEPSVFSYEAFRIYFSLRNANPKLKEALFKFSAAHKHITYFVEWIGEWDVCLGVIVPDAAAVSGLVNEIYDLLGSSLDKLVLFPIIRDVKMSFFPVSEN